MHDLVNNFLSGVNLKIFYHNLLPPKNVVQADKKLSDVTEVVQTILTVSRIDLLNFTTDIESLLKLLSSSRKIRTKFELNCY